MFKYQFLNIIWRVEQFPEILPETTNRGKTWGVMALHLIGWDSCVNKQLFVSNWALKYVQTFYSHQEAKTFISSISAKFKRLWFLIISQKSVGWWVWHEQWCHFFRHSRFQSIPPRYLLFRQTFQHTHSLLSEQKTESSSLLLQIWSLREGWIVILTACLTLYCLTELE